ncbi:MAG: hypothetical protein KDB61_08765 [Planctomycetes bacterium]|nr:hypothetical protein [Planctomycetota bacterium]
MVPNELSTQSLLRTGLLLTVCAIVCPELRAQQFDFALNTGTSTLNMVSTFGVDMDATLIGNYDPVTNPGGTQTIPGVLGGSGNNSIPVDLGLNGDLNHNGAPTGTFSMNVDELALNFTLDGLDMDLLGGASVVSNQDVDLLFSTFHTVNPSSVFLGGIPVNLPLAGQSVSDLIVVQTGGPVQGSLISGIVVGSYGFSAQVPVAISLTADFQGTPTPVGPFDGSILVSGSLVMNGGAPSVSIAFNQVIQQTTVDPLPGQVFSDIPFDAPTILPAGSTAHFLLGGSVAQVDLNMTLTGNLAADGTQSCGFTRYCMGAPNSAGLFGELHPVGSTDVTQGSLTLNSTNLPLNVFGYYLFSPSRASQWLPAPSQGLLCVGAPLYRLNATQYILYSGATGTMSLAVDFQNLPQGQVFTPGSTWCFQLWHRDQNPSNTSNTTNAVEVWFCQ